MQASKLGVGREGGKEVRSRGGVELGDREAGKI